MEQKKLSVQVDGNLSREVEAYCSMYAIDTQQVIESALSEYLEQHQPLMEELIEGYTEMASINSEICQEFSASECEAYLHIVK
ncbi:hypothetical protein ACFQ5M_00500 [Agrilactobacillus yilanensis]|uniref:CopG family transcriptional regulator n=1 Tax=Agrilactobacillus yilanensis TaxID=2485997 RepID=A0ABW4J5M4_9LACO|nr:hypothetical protein [Agrilactobacillus yilanensis]